MPKQPFVMEAQPDLHKLVHVAEVLARMDPESIVFVGTRDKDAVRNDPTLLDDIRTAIHHSRDAIVIQDPDVDNNVKQWVSGLSEYMISQGPCSDLQDLGQVPEGHVIIGLAESCNVVVVRGQVLEDQKVDWSWKIDEQRLAAADRIFKSPENDDFFRDNNYTYVECGDWYSDGNEWSCAMKILDASGWDDSVEMHVEFEPDSDKISRVTYDGIELCLDAQEDNSP